MARRLFRWCGVWCAATLIWAAGVTAVVAARIGEQVSASEDLARDIAALDGGQGGALVTQWQDIVALMLEYRAEMLLEIVLLPPLAAFLLAMAWLAWRRWAPRIALRPAYSGAIRGAARFR